MSRSACPWRSPSRPGPTASRCLSSGRPRGEHRSNTTTFAPWGGIMALSEGRRVAAVGIGYSTLGRATGLTPAELVVQSVTAALDDARVKPADVDGVAVLVFHQHHVSAGQTAALVGIPTLSWASTASDATAYIGGALHAIAAVASGLSEIAVAIRVIQREGTSGGPAPDRVPGDAQFVAPFGGGHPTQWAAMFKQRMMSEYGWGEE